MFECVAGIQCSLCQVDWTMRVCSALSALPNTFDDINLRYQWVPNYWEHHLEPSHLNMQFQSFKPVNHTAGNC